MGRIVDRTRTLAGQVRGLPVGLQMVAPKFEYARVLQIAALLERLAP